MTGKVAGTPIADLYTDKKKILVFNAVLLMVCVGAGYGVAASAQNTAVMTAIIGGLAVFWLFVSFFTWGQYMKPPRVKLFYNGISFSGLGFWPFEACRCAYKNGQLHFTIQVGDKDVPETTTESGVKDYHLNNETRTLTFYYDFYGFFTSISPKAFFEAVQEYHPDQKPADKGKKKKKG